MPYSNTPIGVRNDGTSMLPSAYTVKEFLMTNSRGETRDINRLITGFSITEDLFSPVLELSVSLRDDVNFMEEFGISGQEVIQIQLTRKNHEVYGESVPVKLDFIVVEYSNHSRDDSDWHVQNYSFMAISDFAYLSGLKKISRGISGSTIDNIAKILQNDLNISANRLLVRGEPTSNFKGVLNIQSPLSAVKWLIKKTFDSNGSPFFLHQTMSSGKLIMASYLDLINLQEPYNTYYHSYAAQANPSSSYGFAERASRILEMKSNVSFNMLDQAQNGAFASSSNFLDISSKTYYNRAFSNKSAGKNGLRFKTGKDTETSMSLSEISNSSINEVPINSMAYGPNADNAKSGGFDMAIHNAYSAMARAETYSHSIVLNGDYELNPGTIITLKIPKSINPELHSDTRSELTDNGLSGNYLIKNTVHSFQQGTYHSALKVIRN